MRPVDARALLVVVGSAALWVGLTDTALLYVRPSARPWLLAAAVALVLLGVGGALLSWRASRQDGDPGHRHHLRRVGWLLALPVAVSIAVGSNPLGSYAAGRQNGERTLPPGEFDLEQYLAAGSISGQAPALRVMDFLRAAADPDDADLLAETPVRLTGFVTHDDRTGHDHHFILNRFTIGCCAADAIVMAIRVEADGHGLPAVDEWVEVRGRLSSTPGDELVVVAAEDVRQVDRPPEVYEYPP